MRRTVVVACVGLLVASLSPPPVASRTARLPSPLGPCTRAAAKSMPVGEDHDHLDVTQHEFSCRFRQVFFDSLTDELADEPDVALGEMDVARGVAAVGVAFPESGVLFFDVSNPARPKFLSWYRATKCETVVFDVDCGAYVDLSRDGKVAFLSLQNLTVLPGSPPDPGVRPTSETGVEVIDVRDPAAPVLTQTYPVASQGGVHTSKSHVIPDGPTDDGPRAPGEYLFSVANGFGIEVTRVERPGEIPQLAPVNRIDIDEVHDMYVQNDRISKRTYLYVAAGSETGFYVYDVTDPAQEELLAEWDITPDCPQDWYSHTIQPVIRKRHRYVTVDAEIFDLGAQQGGQPHCGAIYGNADKPGPLWIVDATDLQKLGPAVAQGEDDVEALKAASERALVTTWTNPAGRAGGNLTFSPHNQHVVGNRIYLSHYHGGIYVLGARAAFRGRSVRPRERGFVLPHGGDGRPIYELSPEPASPFFSAFPPSRPRIWDVRYYRGYVLTADWHGGFYSFQFEGDRKRAGKR
ncbi:MAG: hypothetical protein M3271_06665 [Actinomycetota bacterium]|nr:hypothetical protein [Actinomycetota bacterium]